MYYDTQKKEEEEEEEPIYLPGHLNMRRKPPECMHAWTKKKITPPPPIIHNFPSSPMHLY